MADADLICRLFPARPGAQKLPDDAINELNATRMRPQLYLSRMAHSSTGEPPTEAVTTSRPIAQRARPPQYSKYLELRFSHGPRSRNGFIFGSHGGMCDIVLPGDKNISNHHCTITFDRLDGPGSPYVLVVRDVGSRYGTAVSYDKRLSKDRRRNFRWIVGGHQMVQDCQRVTLQICKGCHFHVYMEPHDMTTPQFLAKIETFLQGTEPTEGLFENLNIPSFKSTALGTGFQTPGEGLVFLEVDNLGSGAFGSVKRVQDVSSGKQYAVKEPRQEDIESGEMNQRDWFNEALNTLKVSHQNIISIVEVISKPHPKLVLEYLPGGSLNSHKNLTHTECAKILYQCLDALSHLHGQSPPIAHRDIKPENILVQYRDGRGNIKVKLADFGLSKEADDYKSFRGSKVYAAPELRNYEGKIKPKVGYTPAVDLWSLGIVIFECARGKRMQHSQARVDVWARGVVETLKQAVRTDDDPIGLYRFLQTLVAIDPAVRGTAGIRFVEAAFLCDGIDEDDFQVPRSSTCGNQQRASSEGPLAAPTRRPAAALLAPPHLHSAHGVRARSQSPAVSRKRRASSADPQALTGSGSVHSRKRRETSKSIAVVSSIASQRALEDGLPDGSPDEVPDELSDSLSEISQSVGTRVSFNSVFGNESWVEEEDSVEDPDEDLDGDWRTSFAELVGTESVSDDLSMSKWDDVYDGDRSGVPCTTPLEAISEEPSQPGDMISTATQAVVAKQEGSMTDSEREIVRHVMSLIREE